MTEQEETPNQIDGVAPMGNAAADSAAPTSGAAVNDAANSAGCTVADDVASEDALPGSIVEQDSTPVEKVVEPETLAQDAAALAQPFVLKERIARPTYQLSRPVFFVGFMVAGKTSTARRLARNCGVAAVDLDAFIERREGKPINQIFAEIGEDGFRAMETDVLRDFSQRDPLLISCGGGVVLRPENREILKTSGYVVYLKVTAEQAYARVGDVSTRPLFRDLDTARKTINGRLPMYEEVADVTIDTVGKTIGDVAREARRALEKEGVLWQQK